MQIKSLNGTIEVTEADREKLVSSLIKAGISEKAIAPVFGVIGPKSECCEKYFSVQPDALQALKREIVNKKIDVRKLDAKIVKIIGG